jgi:hypothetical protein
MSRIDDALRYLAEQISATREEFWRDNQPGGSALLEGVLSHGYVMRKGDRVALSPAGHRRLKAVEPAPSAVDALG